MCDTADNSPYICFKGEHLNLIQINLQSESSTEVALGIPSKAPAKIPK